jgi:uncharacterized protein (TIGR02147 family)
MQVSAPERSIFEFDDYRELLKHLYAQSKLRNKNFSYRFFARMAGFASANFLKQVTDGKSKLSEKSIQKFIKGFKLNLEEGTFFRHLVFLNQSATASEREIHAREILRCRSYRKIHPLKETQYKYFSTWYYVSVRELVNFPDFRENPEWIARSIVPAISVEQAREALEVLLALGLLERNDEGRLVQSTKNLTSMDHVVSASLAHCHKELMKRASESIDRIPRDKRDISFVTFAMSEKNIQKIKSLIDAFRKDLLEAVAAEAPCDSVYQLNLQLFPTAQSGKRGEDEKAS